MESILGKLVSCLLLVELFYSFHVFGCYKVELDALMELKSYINYPNGSALAHWSFLSNCCYWDEVGCGETGHVIFLSVSQVRSKAARDWYVNASFFLPFPHLQTLVLDSNFITGWTHHLTHLSSLETLSIQDNNLRGTIDVYDIVALKNLKFLNLDGNPIDCFKQSHGNLSKTSKLETLSLRGILFSDANTFLNSLSLFPSVKTLCLGYNNLGSIQIGLLCKLKNIQNLLIGKNDLQDQFPLCLRNFTSLRRLDLKHNNLHGRLPPFLANLTALQSLDLSSNQFMGNLENSPLTKLTSLWDLRLSDNNFQIPHTFTPFLNHSTLRTLFLDGNKVTQVEGTQQHVTPKFQLSFLSMSNCGIVAKLPHFILSQVNLTYLDLSHNSIEGNFPRWILENNKPLAFLYLANNSFSGSLHLSSHYELMVLDVSNNHFNYLSTNLSQFIPNILFLNVSKNLIKTIIPSNFGGMKNLSCLDLSYNHVGRMSKNCFKGCVSLEALYLSHNKLENTPSLTSSTSLNILLLNNNNLSGKFPSSLFPSSLLLLDMSNNHLGGKIPAKICKLKFLNFLNLSNNSFSGFLPPCFDGSNLEFVFLNNNLLNGSLLPVFYNNTSLMTLDLGNNHFSGVIPKWIGEIHSLSSLILRNNNFEGEIPNEICSLDQLSILDLSTNNLSGPIPHCLSHFTFQPVGTKSSSQESFFSILNLNTTIVALNMGGLRTSWEDFSFLTIQNELDITTKGHTYNYMGVDLDDMTILDLSCNNLRGEIPHELGSMFGVRAVNLSHNKLDGLIPSTLSNLSLIESLDLSFNHLNGSIPFQLMQLYKLEVFNVTYNNLSGSIPEKAQFGTFDQSSYQGNPYLCGPPLLKDCSTNTPIVPRDQFEENVDASFDMYVFTISFVVSSLIIFVSTLVVLWVNPNWRKMWFYFAEMWITCVYYFIVDNTRKTITTLVGFFLRFIHCH